MSDASTYESLRASDASTCESKAAAAVLKHETKIGTVQDELMFTKRATTPQQRALFDERSATSHQTTEATAGTRS